MSLVFQSLVFQSLVFQSFLFTSVFFASLLLAMMEIVKPSHGVRDRSEVAKALVQWRLLAVRRLKMLARKLSALTTFGEKDIGV
jgi:hypothetical protein